MTRPPSFSLASGWSCPVDRVRKGAAPSNQGPGLVFQQPQQQLSPKFPHARPFWEKTHAFFPPLSPRQRRTHVFTRWTTPKVLNHAPSPAARGAPFHSRGQQGQGPALGALLRVRCHPSGAWCLRVGTRALRFGLNLGNEAAIWDPLPQGFSM